MYTELEKFTTQIQNSKTKYVMVTSSQQNALGYLQYSIPYISVKHTDERIGQ